MSQIVHEKHAARIMWHNTLLRTIYSVANLTSTLDELTVQTQLARSQWDFRKDSFKQTHAAFRKEAKMVGEEMATLRSALALAQTKVGAPSSASLDSPVHLYLLLHSRRGCVATCSRKPRMLHVLLQCYASSIYIFIYIYMCYTSPSSKSTDKCTCHTHISHAHVTRTCQMHISDADLTVDQPPCHKHGDRDMWH